jgi:hypothetical protein
MASFSSLLISAQRRDAGEGLAQTVVELAAQTLLFSIDDLEHVPLQPPPPGHVSRCGVDPPAPRYLARVPLQPAMRPVPAEVAVLEQDRSSASDEPIDLRQRGLAVIARDEIEERPGQKLV